MRPDRMVVKPQFGGEMVLLEFSGTTYRKAPWTRTFELTSDEAQALASQLIGEAFLIRRTDDAKRTKGRMASQDTQRLSHGPLS